MTYNYNFESSLSRQRITEILRLCDGNPTNVFQLAEHLNLSLDCARAFLRHLLVRRKLYICNYQINNKSLVRYYLTGDKESVQVDDYVKSTEAERKARKARADKLRNLRNKEQRGATYKVTKAGKVKTVKVVPDEIKPDIHSAWMFNPIC
jgi:predicted transcriptional regulator